ncbi:EAL domain-containing protein [Pseudocolwellia sp. AS88]|uniref:two-component system response regulator n=1 Tax=Pseudocolwellia sp. AS88 TaxID=3063958 RepID=UPI0026F09166|nr:GGDEF domain-containing response regulator [Pseudocolwellia sp. AS88]MDO7083297.1 EAL domain-containing protein [Pseudocolwellia sp. AS88]
MKILLVDDDLADREIIKRTLSRNIGEFELIEANSAEEGLKAAELESFDVLLLDYRMPEVDGIEMVIELRSKPNLGEAAIVMMSATDDEVLALSCLQAGAQDFIPKNEITATKLKRAIIQAKKRFELEKKVYDSFCQVRELAEKDSLTGLSNRYHFEEALKVSIDNNKRFQSNIALLLLDLDHFKNVNDTYGHEVGDKLLKYVVNLVKQCLRGNELFGRLGGDEFAIFITGLNLISGATSVAQRIIKSLENPIEIDGHTIQCGVSIGIALHPQNASTAESLTKYADIAMYRAKKQGRNQLCYFENEMQQQFSRSYKVEMELKKSVINKDFDLHYQPVINVKDKSIVGVEALIRWPNSKLNSTPDEFIPIAEQSNIIDKIGEWVLETAIKQLAIWHRKFNKPLTMAINISAKQLNNSTLIPTFEYMLNKYDINPESIVLEFTETALLAQDEKNHQRITEFYRLGCKLALDDFGTGFSSLSHLLNYPINIVKLDKSLLPNCNTEERHLSIVKGIAAMAKTIGLHIIAEGVETQYQSNLCSELEVDELQGYFFAKALPANELAEKWLK